MTTDDNLFAQIRDGGLHTAVLGDVLDQMGLRHCFLPAGIAPLQSESVLIGRAMPVLEADVFDDGSPDAAGPLNAKPFGLMLEALDNLRPGEVYIASGASPRYALWGELMTVRARTLGAAGAVLNGFVRDARGIEAQNFPCFNRGLYAQDQGPRGKVIDYRCTIEFGGIRVAPGALIFGDREGVLVIPAEAETEAVARALEKSRTENIVETAIRGGMSTCEAFAKFGVM